MATQTPDAFHALVAHHLRQIRNREIVSEEASVSMVRAWNTIQQDGLADADPVYREFSDAFMHDYVEEVRRVLDCVEVRGLSYYCPKHDVYIGGRIHANSRFI